MWGHSRVQGSLAETGHLAIDTLHQFVSSAVVLNITAASLPSF